MRFLKLAILALPLVAIACASPTESDATSEDALTGSQAPIAEGSFKLYPEAHASPSPGCDLHTTLKLEAAGKAKLDSALDGFCEIFVAPDPREYNLKVSADGCGSFIYKGKKSGRSIEITDNRTRTCEDVIPALVVVRETVGSQTQTLYSLDRPSEPAVFCPQVFDPVCGTDDHTYGNSCEAGAAGVSVAYQGACDRQREYCGGIHCGPGQVCCNPLMQICAAPGDFCAM